MGESSIYIDDLMYFLNPMFLQNKNLYIYNFDVKCSHLEDITSNIKYKSLHIMGIHADYNIFINRHKQLTDHYGYTITFDDM
jgi:hypothetical protein